MTHLIRGRSYMELVKQFAKSRGLLFWTVKDQSIARALYNEHAERNN